MSPRRLLVVDAANVVGSRPDGWWHDRRGAARRLRDQLAALPDDGGAERPDVVLVVEGRARGVEPVPGVSVVEAEASGDDAVVAVVRSARQDERDVTVATADRELRSRVVALGAVALGPVELLRRLAPPR